MPHFQSEGYEIAYSIHGEGPSVLLVHGFGSNGKVNWVDTGWVDSLVRAGYRVITIDNRGHGKSQKKSMIVTPIHRVRWLKIRSI